MSSEQRPDRDTPFRIEEVDEPSPRDTMPTAGALVDPELRSSPQEAQSQSRTSDDVVPAESPGPERNRDSLFRIEEVSDPPVARPETSSRQAPISVEEVDDTRPITVAEPAAPPPKTPATREGRWRASIILATSFGLVVLLAAIDWVLGLVDQRSVLAVPAAIGILGCVGGASTVLWREYRSLQRLRDAEELRSLLLAPAETNAHRSQVLAGLRAWTRTLPEAQRKPAEAFLSSIAQEQSVARIRRGLEAEVLFSADDRALEAVHRTAYDMFFLVAISPTALTDTAVFIARSMRMISEVATNYGARPSRLARLQIARRSLADVALVSAATIAAGAAAKGVGDVLKDLGAIVSRGAAASGDPISTTVGFVAGAGLSAGGSIMERAGGEIAGAITASIRIAQLGLLVMNTTRPLPLDADRQILLAGELRRRILSFKHHANGSAISSQAARSG